MSRYGCMGWMSNGRFLAQLFLQHINSWLVISGIKTYHVCINEPKNKWLLNGTGSNNSSMSKTLSKHGIHAPITYDICDIVHV